MSHDPILFKDIDEPGLVTLDVYQRRGGYEALKRALKMTPEEVLAELNASASAAAAAPASRWARRPPSCPRARWTSTSSATPTSPSPARSRTASSCRRARTCSSRAWSSPPSPPGANKSFIYIRGEYELQAAILEAAIAEAEAAGFLGERILGSDHTLSLVLHRGAGAYICGEETGLLDSLEGKRGNPRLKPPFPAVQGLYQGPTLINNVETLATVPHIIRMGGEEYAKIGTETSTGTKLVSISGDVQPPGQLRDRARDALAGDHLRPRRRPARGPRGQVLVPRRLVLAGAPGATTSTCPTTSTRWPRRARCSARARSSSSTTPTRSSRSR